MLRQVVCVLSLAAVAESLEYHAVIVSTARSKGVKQLCSALAEKGCTTQLWHKDQIVKKQVSHVFDLRSASLDAASDVFLRCVGDEFKLWTRVLKSKDSFENDFYQGTGFSWCILDADHPESAALLVGNEDAFGNSEVTESELKRKVESSSGKNTPEKKATEQGNTPKKAIPTLVQSKDTLSSTASKKKSTTTKKATPTTTQDENIPQSTENIPPNKDQAESSLSSSDTAAPSSEFSSPVMTSPGDYESLTVAKLKEILRGRELKVSGKKAELIDRLRLSDTN